MKKAFKEIILFSGLLMACVGAKKNSAVTASGIKSPITIKLELSTAVFTPDKNPDDGLVCYLTNNTENMLEIGMDTLFKFFTLYGQGNSQKYPMFLNYNLPAEFSSKDKLYIDPGKTEAIFRSPLDQLFFNQLRFGKGESGWMWQSTIKQKVDFSPVHDYDKLQKEALLWFDLKWGGQNYSSNKVKLQVTPKS
jgi:hypothetical protein